MDGMKDEITISELANLMQVSVHQIRYFEEKGVLQPAYTGENQYRMYGMDEVYRLAHILLLRKMGLSVQMIKDCLSHLTAEQIYSAHSSGAIRHRGSNSMLALIRWDTSVQGRWSWWKNPTCPCSPLTSSIMNFCRIV